MLYSRRRLQRGAAGKPSRSKKNIHTYIDTHVRLNEWQILPRGRLDYKTPWQTSSWFIEPPAEKFSFKERETARPPCVRSFTSCIEYVFSRGTAVAVEIRRNADDPGCFVYVPIHVSMSGARVFNPHLAAFSSSIYHTFFFFFFFSYCDSRFLILVLNPVRRALLLPSWFVLHILSKSFRCVGIFCPL